MKFLRRGIFILLCVFFLAAAYGPLTATAATPAKKAKTVKADAVDQWSAKPNAVFDAGKMSDMSDYDPGSPVIPRAIQSNWRSLFHFQGRLPFRDRPILHWFSGRRMTSTNAAVSGWTGRRS